MGGIPRNIGGQAILLARSSLTSPVRPTRWRGNFTTALTGLVQQLPQSRHTFGPGKPGLGRAAVRDVGWYGRGLAGLLTGLALLAGALAGCSAFGGSAAQWGPAEPYAHEPMTENSVAVPVAGGEVGIVAGALEAAGYFCAQVRSNDASRQIWCRTVPEGRSSVDSAVTRVDLVSTLNGQLQYAYFGLPDPTGIRLVDDRERQLVAVLNASILTLWPDDSEQVRDVAAKVANPALGLGIKDRSDPRPPARETTTTEHGTYMVGEGRYFSEGATVTGSPVLTLTLTTKVAADRSWPFGAEHYATTTTAAAAGLEAGGFDCYGPDQSPCTRPAGNQQVIYTTRDRTHQILTASVGMGGGIHEPGQGLTSLAQWGLPRGLTFLTPAVRTAVEKQLTHARLTGESFIGILNGTVVVLDARKTAPQPDGTYAVHVNLTVGAPLVTIPDG